MADRHTKPYGFQLYDCWGDFLDTDNQTALTLFKECYDGVRLMTKFEWKDKNPKEYQRVIDRAERAKEMGKKIHLVIDWHNQASGPNSYHSSVYRPTLNKMAREVGAIIKDHPRASMLEVCNEPYVVKSRSSRPSIAEYKAYVQAYMEGAAIGNFRGAIVATQSQRLPWMPSIDGYRIADGWEWGNQWNDGMLEGKHTAVLHTETMPDGVWDLISKGWYNGKPIGWQWPIYESECAPVGTLVASDSTEGYEMTLKVLEEAKRAQMPLCLGFMGGNLKDFGESNNWAGAMHLTNKNWELAQAGEAIYELRNKPVQVFKPGEEEDEPPIIIDEGDATLPNSPDKAQLIIDIEKELRLLNMGALRGLRRFLRAMNR